MAETNDGALPERPQNDNGGTGKRDDDSVENAKRVEAFYTLLRDYIKHEDGLINQRATWLMSVQAFLIATFGLSYQKKFEVLANAFIAGKVQQLQVMIAFYDVFLLLLVAIGIMTSIRAGDSVRAAMAALGRLTEHWNSFVQGQMKAPFSLPASLDYLPGIVGGGHPDAPGDGIRLADALPEFFRKFWLVMAVFVFFASCYDAYLVFQGGLPTLFFE